jgi:hypothetical protein
MHSLPSFHTAMQQVASLKTWASGALSAEASHIAARITDATQSAATTAAAGLQSAGYDLATTGRTIATEIGRNFVLPAISAVYRISDVALYAKDVLQVPADQLASFFRSGLGFSSGSSEVNPRGRRLRGRSSQQCPAQRLRLGRQQPQPEQVVSQRAESTQRFLAEVGTELATCPQVLLEFSIRLRPQQYRARAAG